jgi:hypothetical protein
LPPLRKRPRKPNSDINVATADQLKALPGIGSLPEKIIKGRPYQRKDELAEEDSPRATYEGISQDCGEAEIGKIAEYHHDPDQPRQRVPDREFGMASVNQSEYVVFHILIRFALRP